MDHCSGHAAHVRSRHRAPIRLQHLQHNRHSDGGIIWLTILRYDMATDVVPTERIAQAIYVIRNQRVMLDFDLARLYGVTTGALNQAVRRNQASFPADLMFRLTVAEEEDLKCQIGISNKDPRL